MPITMTAEIQTSTFEAINGAGVATRSCRVMAMMYGLDEAVES